MYRKETKIIASMLVFILTIAQLSTIGQVFASSLETQSTKTKVANVEFDAFFMSENAKTHSSTQIIGEENYLYTQIAVKNAGYLKNIVVNAENANFTIGQLESKEVAKVEANKVYFNQINNGSTSEVAFPIQILQKNSISVEDLNKVNNIKLTATYVDGNGKENKVEKEIKTQLAYTAVKQADLSMQVTKFIPYNVKEQKGLVLQVLVKSNLVNNALPVKEDKVEISVPTINEIKPEQIKVSANTTSATNGDIKAENFVEENYIYNEETNKLTIQVNNEADEQGNISWVKNSQDEFIVTYVYSEEALNSISEEGVKVKLEANNEITVYEAGEEKVQNEVSEEVILKDQISNLVDFEIKTETENIGKGQIYANEQAKNKVETEYKEIITANVGLAEITDSIILEANSDELVINEEQKVSASNSTYYKTLSVEKEEIEKLLSEEGQINVFVGTTVVATINNETEANEDGKITINLAELNVNELKIVTTKPQVDGEITFELTKAIKTETGYTNAQVAKFNALELNVLGKAMSSNEEFVNQAIEKQIALTEPTSQAELKIDNKNLSTVVTNENVKITAVLKTDTQDSKLYKDPTLQITLPKHIEEINIKNIEVLFETEGTKLALAGYNVVQNADGTKTIVINLDGTQTEYTLGAVSKGVNVIITADIKVNELTPNIKDTVKMTYANNNTVNQLIGQGTDTNTIAEDLDIVSPVGVYTNTKIKYSPSNGITTEKNEDEGKLIVNVPANSDAREITLTMTALNNYQNAIENVSVLGRTFAKDNKDIVTNADLASNMDAPLTSAITVNDIDASKVTVYYSENGSATKDVNQASNGWTTSPADLSKVKSYLIVLNNYTLNASENLSFTYKAQVPANLAKNLETTANFAIYFKNGTTEDNAVGSKITITTGSSPVLNAQVKSNIAESEKISEGRIIKYTITVKNTGRGEAKNVVATYEVPSFLTKVIEDSTSSTGYKTDTEATKTIKLDNIPAGKTITKEVYFKVGNLSEADLTNKEENTATANLKITVNADDLETPAEATSNNNTITKAYYREGITLSIKDGGHAKEGSEIRYTIDVYSKDKEEKENTVLKIKVPEELTYKEAEVVKFVSGEGYQEQDANINYNDKTREITIELGNVDSQYGKTVNIVFTVNKLNIENYEKEISLQATVQGTNTPIETSEKTTIKLIKQDLKISQTSSITENATLSASEDFKYTITIENPTPAPISNVKVTDYLPEELIFIKSIKTSSDGSKSTKYKLDGSDNNLVETLYMEANSTATIEIYVKAKALENTKKINNKVAIEQTTLGKIEANSISHTIAKYEEETFVEETTKKRIVGTVWEDANKNGIMDSDEKKVSNVEVALFNNTTKEYIKDSEGNMLTVKTSEDGTYNLTNLDQGSYTVVFLYNNANYSATTYKVKDAQEEVNSNATDSQTTINGEIKTVAITEEIKITDSNIYNINLGLVENPKFDLKLNKTVSKLTVQDSTGTNVYDLGNTKLAKKDIVGKQVNSTTIIVEYKISVTNEGAVSGYVKKIADYKPAEMTFNSELNKDWYEGENGTLLNSSLANTLINPGETKEVTLLLTKKLSEENLGLYNNTAEIYEAYNDLGIADTDSKPANKTTNEDDMSSADVLISVKTGETVLFIGLSIAIILIIGTGAFIIKKKVLR